MTKRLLGVGVGVVLLAVVAVFILGVLKGPQHAGTQYGKAPLTEEQTARQAYELLIPWMRGWATDAEVVALSTSYAPSDPQVTGWSFQVYSAGRQRMAVVLVQPGQVWVLSDRPTPYPQTPIALSAWVLDSGDFLTRWWEARGGQAWIFMKNPTLYVHLRMESGGLVWQVNLIENGGVLVDSWMIRADTGEEIKQE